jgi:hypothetical protein
MIPTKTDTISVESSIQGTDVAMTIDEAATQHIMSVLTELYSDPIAAVVREYSTNAADAHVEAGNPGAISVTTPTHLNPTFTVQDRGTGLDEADIRAIYSRYGASTKRATNDQNGTLGLGCKSALAYTDQFNLVGIKNGIRTMVAISRDADGTGKMTVLEAGATDEPNGVTIMVPVNPRDAGEFEKAAERLFSFWHPGTVELNGEAPARFEGLRVTDELWAADELPGSLTNHAVVMSGVPYPVEAGPLPTGLPYRKRLIAFVPNGSVHFTPSREALMMTSHTKRTLAEVVAKFKQAAPAAMQREVDAATTRGEAAMAAYRVRELLGQWAKAAPTWRGEALPERITSADRTTQLRIVTRTGGLGHTPSIPLKVAVESIWLTNFTNAKWTRANWKKLQQYLEVEKPELGNPGYRTYIATSGDRPGGDWTAECLTIDWADIRAWRDPERPKRAQGGGSYAGTYPAWTSTDGYSETYPAASLAKFKHIVYSAFSSRSEQRKAVQELLGDDVAIVRVARPREAKFKRLFPNARPLGDILRAAADAWFATITEDQKQALANQNAPRLPSMLDEARVDDPELRRAMRLNKLLTPELSKAYHTHNRFLTVTLPKPDGKNWRAIYPLASRSYSRLHKDHVHLYINAVYAANQKGA